MALSLVRDCKGGPACRPTLTTSCDIDAEAGVETIENSKSDV